MGTLFAALSHIRKRVYWNAELTFLLFEDGDDNRIFRSGDCLSEALVSGSCSSVQGRQSVGGSGQ